MRESKGKTASCEAALVSGTAADVAITVAKQNRQKSWEDLRTTVARQIAPWTTVGKPEVHNRQT